MTIAKVRVVQGTETLLAWRGINIQRDKTIKELFEYVVEQYVPKLYDEVLESIVTRSSSQKEEIGDIIEMDCFAEDTGLEVEALNGEPGVKSARYAGEEKSFKKNIEKLFLKKLNAN